MILDALTIVVFFIVIFALAVGVDTLMNRNRPKQTRPQPGEPPA